MPTLKNLPKAFLIIVVASFFVQFGMGLHVTVINIFMEGPLGLDGDQVGLVVGVREIPGLLTVVLALSALFFTESKLAAICVGFISMGLLLTSRVTGMPGLMIAILFYSTGFHLYFPLQNAMVLRVVNPKERARRLGQISSVAAIATLSAMGVARILVPLIDYRPLFLIAAVVASVSIFLFVARSKSDEKVDLVQSRGFVFKFKYIKYYVLTLLGGSRRHIGQTFAIYLLLRIYGVPGTTMITLTLISTSISIFSRPMLGNLIDRIGERKGLALNYAIITFLFLCYAFVRIPHILFAVFIIDQLCVGFDVGVTTYLSKIAEPEDLKPSLAMGSTINHITGVLVPISGGYIFTYISPSATFLLGALVSAAALIQAFYLTETPKTDVTIAT